MDLSSDSGGFSCPPRLLLLHHLVLHPRDSLPLPLLLSYTPSNLFFSLFLYFSPFLTLHPAPSLSSAPPPPPRRYTTASSTPFFLLFLLFVLLRVTLLLRLLRLHLRLLHLLPPGLPHLRSRPGGFPTTYAIRLRCPPMISRCLSSAFLSSTESATSRFFAPGLLSYPSSRLAAVTVAYPTDG